MKKIKLKFYAEALYELTKGTNELQTKELIAKFARLLIRNHTEHKVDAIIKAFVKKQEQEEGMYPATIITAHKLDGDLKKQIQKTLGSKAALEEQVDTQILGGIIVKTEDTILDGSIRTQLLKLKQALVK
jgi:F-type H+-transporting ATPase subunit delta